MKCLYEGVIVPAALYLADAWGMRSAESWKVNVLEMKCLECLEWITLGMKERIRAGIERELASTADQRVLRWFERLERMDECRMARRLLIAEVSGGGRGRPRLRWMDGVKVAFGNRGVTVEAAQKIRRTGEPWYICNRMSFTRPFLLGPVFFRTALPCSCGYHLETSGMPLHDAVVINCKKGAITENQGADVEYMG